MKIAFYAPLKAPDHPVPSGDRHMARLIIRAMEMAGFEVTLASTLRAYIPEPDLLAMLRRSADEEKERLTREWTETGKPDLWFTYHPYYKAPDLIGPDLARHFDIPYVTAEASYSPKRDRQGWGATQAWIREAITLARLNLCFTDRDREGLGKAVPQGRFASLLPFIDTAPYADGFAKASGRDLVTVAMMRKGDKFASFTMLAKALPLLIDLPWRLTVIGDGPARAETRALFADLPADRFDWRGEIATDAIPDALREGGIYVWPGCGEAYGLAYLEAQASGIPVVAQATAGVPTVVEHGRTGLLTPDGDVTAYAAAIRDLLCDEIKREAYGKEARAFVLGERSLSQASRHLARLLTDALA
jgi:glycosyltransferase involved in cell wall biosynthesis